MTATGKSIQRAFDEFHAANPGVYTSLVRLARQARARGHQKLGIELLFAVLRWEHMMATSDPSQAAFKLNDHYTSRYSRLLMGQEPDLAGMFTVRQLRSTGPNRLYDIEFDPDGQARLAA